MSNPVPSAARWRKSSYSSGTGGNCVEVASFAPVTGIRDSKNPDGPNLLVAAETWRAFTAQVKSGAHDLP
ncbi:DUF397 domain-containing protein [Actinomadura atramentaria]|uniref:DUF397 domain-containing protein n=1 Tax=Actinomadura atramentaria TaxID=1990 RepID=UPI000368CD0F|nr:DUF397 domain-containing protein [Actinomadura atramentaria]